MEQRPYLSSLGRICPVRKVSNKVFTVVWGKEKEFLTRKVMLVTTARRYTLEQIEAARKKLRSLPVKEAGKTRAEVAEFLVNDIKKAMRQGYTLRDIRDLLADAGVSVPLARLQGLFEKAPKPKLVLDKEEAGKDTPHPGGTGEKGKQESPDGE